MDRGRVRADGAILRAASQAVLFSARPRRSELSALTLPSGSRQVRLGVLRNHAFEFVVSALPAFAAFAGYCVSCELSAYDDALSHAPQACDVWLVWLDYARYSFGPQELASWLAERLRGLRGASATPILVADWPDDSDSARTFNSALERELSVMPAVYVAPLAETARTVGAGFFDARARAIGSRLGDAAFVETARRLALQWLPATLEPRIKAIALDLDNTLYAGVLGEDGPLGVELTPAHRALQQALVELQQSGILLAILSKNEELDARQLFDQRRDFPLRADHITAWGVSWQDKPRNLRRIVEALRISAEAVLVVDDNPGELTSLASSGAALLHASADAELTRSALARYPRLFRWRASAEDALRAHDLRASDERDRLASELSDPRAYISNLEISLRCQRAGATGVARAHELSHKTNQFNLGLARLNEVEVAERAATKHARLVLISLKDRLSDSGVVGLVSSRLDGSRVIVDELCISCRALGRGLENKMVEEAARVLANGADEIGFSWRRGPRNGPALDWLGQFATLEGEAGVAWVPLSRLHDELPIRVEWEG